MARTGQRRSARRSSAGGSRLDLAALDAAGRLSGRPISYSSARASAPGGPPAGRGRRPRPRPRRRSGRPRRTAPRSRPPRILLDLELGRGSPPSKPLTPAGDPDHGDDPIRRLDGRVEGELPPRELPTSAARSMPSASITARGRPAARTRHRRSSSGRSRVRRSGSRDSRPRRAAATTSSHALRSATPAWSRTIGGPAPSSTGEAATGDIEHWVGMPRGYRAPPCGLSRGGSARPARGRPGSAHPDAAAGLLAGTSPGRRGHGGARSTAPGRRLDDVHADRRADR